MLSLTFHLHIPYQLRKFTFFEIGLHPSYIDQENTQKYVEDTVEKSILPLNKVLIKLLKDTRLDVKFSLAVSGTTFELLEKFAPTAWETFRTMNQTGRVEFLAMPYFHSPSFLFNRNEFTRQVKLYREYIWDKFRQEPCVLYNTRRMYNNYLAYWAKLHGFGGVYLDGVFEGINPNYLYHPPDQYGFPLMLCNNPLSDEINYRFSNPDRSMDASEFAHAIHPGPNEITHLCLEYEAFGIRHSAQTGIFDFILALPDALAVRQRNTFVLPSEAIQNLQTVGIADASRGISESPQQHSLDLWIGAPMQQSSLSELYKLAEPIHALHDDKLIQEWSVLQDADYYRYMSLEHKFGHKLYASFMNRIADLQQTLQRYSMAI